MKSSILSTILILAMSFTACGSSGGLESSRKTGVERSENSDTASRTPNSPPRRERTLEKGTLSSTDGSPSQYSDGLFIEVTNQLIHHKPDLSVAVCSTLNTRRERDQNREESLCFISDKLISYGNTANFYLPQSELDRILARSTGRNVSIKFNDSNSNSFIHWFCWEHSETEISNNGLSHLKVAATQINMASYSCHIESNK